jgi:hypothetical protein
MAMVRSQTRCFIPFLRLDLFTYSPTSAKMQLQRLLAVSRGSLLRGRASTLPRASAKWISSSVPALANPAPHEVKTVFDVHSVEDLQHMSAQEILRETESPGRAAASMRHFTGGSIYYAKLGPSDLNN